MPRPWQSTAAAHAAGQLLQLRRRTEPCPGLPSSPPSLTWNLCTSSRDWLSFWSASRMTSVSLWIMTSRGPCSSIGRLRFSCKEETEKDKLQHLSPRPPSIPTLRMSPEHQDGAGELAPKGGKRDKWDEPVKIPVLYQVRPCICISVPEPHAT